MPDILERIDAASNGLGVQWLRALLRDARAEIVTLRDSGSDPQGENSRSEVEGEASQSGPAKTGHRPDSTSPLNIEEGRGGS